MADVADATRGVSWRDHVREDSRLTEGEVRSILNKAWNFFKHGERDPHGVLEFDDGDTEHLMFMATIECKGVHRNTLAMDTYQCWYVATRPERFPGDKLQVMKDGLRGIGDLDRAGRIARGADLLRELDAELGGRHEPST